MQFPGTLAKGTSGIYAITCLSNGKCYVGSAVNLRGRFAQHMSQLGRGNHHGVRLQRAWAKYGPDAFLYEVLEVVPAKADLIAREQLHIDLLGAAGEWGYNTAPSAGSMAGFRMSVETRAKMSATRKAIGLLPAFQEAAKAVWLGRKHTPEAIAKMKEAKAGTSFPAKAHAAALAANIGHNRAHSEATKAKISAATKGRTNSEKNRAGVSRAHKGVKWTPERIAKRIATLKANREAVKGN